MITLDAKFANQIIEKVQQYTKYNINIMNERGVIVASLTKDRVGTFHEVAQRIIQGTEDEIVVNYDNEYIGTKQGVNTALYYKNRKVGVIGITGDPEQVRPIAMILRMSIETMLEYEMYKEERFQRKSLRDQFLSRVMYGEDVTEDELTEYAKRLQLEEKFVRIPVILRFNKGAEFTEKVLADIREYHYLSHQDISTVTRGNDIIIFKHFNQDLMSLIGDYKIQLAESISPVLRYLKSGDIAYTIYIGSFQNQYVNYRTGYYHCNWLVSNYKQEGRSYYFYDYLNEYFHSFVPFDVLKGIFHVFMESMDQKEQENFVSVMSALTASNYNLTEGCKLIHVHRNTLVYRLDKLREVFGMNPVVDQRGRDFMGNFYEYLVKAR